MNMMTIIVSLLFLLIQAWIGWHKGIIRQGLSLIAAAIAFTVSYWLYNTYGSLIGSKLSTSPGVIAGLLALLGFVLYFLIGAAIIRTFRSTSQQRYALARLFYGLGGSLLGVIMGLVLLSIAFYFLRGSHSGGGGGSSLGSEKIFSSHKLHDAKNAAVVTLEKPVSAAYHGLYKMSKIVSDKRVRARFLEYPDVQKILHTKAVSSLLSDPQFAHALSHHKVFPLLLNSRLYKTLSDPEVHHAIKNVHFRHALDYAVKEPTTAPTTP